VRVAVSADERLSASVRPVLLGRHGTATLPFELAAGGLGEADAVFATTVQGGQQDGDYALEVGWADAVGNVGSAAVAGTYVRVKTSKPTLTVNQAAVVFVRSPWGNGAPEDLGGYTVPAGPYFALEPAEPLSAGDHLSAGTFLLDGGAVPERLQVLAGSMTVGTLFPQPGDTWKRQALASPDTYTVQVVAYDHAGNASDPQPIGTVEWVATSNLPAIGETPHVLWRTPLVEASRVQGSEVVAVAGAEVGGSDQVPAIATAQGVWRKMTFTPNDMMTRARTIDSPGLAYDAARGRVVMFGGRFGGSYMQEVYEWDGRTWRDLTPPAGSPTARISPALAYDGARARVLLFGGEYYVSGSTTRYDDTWEWDGTAWAQKAPASSPPRRSRAGMAYDSARRRMVLFGGTGDSGALGDTWEWDGSAWIPRTPAGASPSARAGHSLVYDHGRGTTVLVGGAADGIVWEWDGSGWTSITPAGTSPSTSAAVFVPDPTSPTNGRVTALGAYSDGTGTHGGAWKWDGTSWTTVTAPGVYPSSITPSIAYDATRGRAVLVVGGRNVGGTWEWDGARWKDVTQTGARPGPRYMYSTDLAYDSGRQRMVLAGGVAGGGDTWEWDGSTWTSVASAAATPSFANLSNPAYDASRGRTFAVDSVSGLTWTWDGAVWTSITPATTTPDRPTLVYDATRHQLLAVGWYAAWIWSGSDWVATTPYPTGNGGYPAFDAASGRALVFAPRASAQSMFEWSGSGWIDVTAVATPPLRNSPGVAYDSERGRLMMFGGTSTTGSIAYQDTWEWIGTAWRDVTPDGTKPQARRMCSLAYDPDRHRTVLFSGNDSGGDVYWNDTWELEARPVTRPAIQLDASMAGAGIDPASVVQLRVRAWAGGAFTVPDPGAIGGSGATLRGWANHSAATGPGGWQTLATSQAGPPPWSGPQSATLISSVVGGTDVRRFVTERDRQLSFQVVPSGTMGPDPGGARVALDYIEVRVRYAAVP
jgi:hypothetical protein